MQINILPPSPPGAMTMMSFPEIAPQARAWINNQIQNAGTMLTDVGRSFLTRAQELHSVYNDGSIERAARRVARTVKSLLHPNAIIALDTVREIQAAKPIMQRYIMANPNIRQLYLKQLCDGYSDTYVDHHPGHIGAEHYDYRRVMDKVVRVELDENGVEDRLVWSHYLEDLQPGDRELEDEEKFTILRIWDIVDGALDARVDPTDIFNGQIGG